MNQTTREKAVSQCVEEAALLWLRREHLIGEPHLSLPDLADRDRQLQARLDELIAAGELGWRACQRELGWEEPGEIFPATLLALAENSPIRLTRVLDYAIRSYELSRPLVAGLAWAPLDGIVDLLEDLLTTHDAGLRRIGLAAAIAHRQVPESAFADALDHPDDGLRARALRGVGEMGSIDLVPRVAEQITGEPSACRFEAAWTCALRAASPSAIEVLLETVRGLCPESERATRMIVHRIHGREAAALLQRLANDPATRRAAIVGAGELGDPARGLADFSVDDSRHARVAGESLQTITGVPLDRPPFQAQPPEAARLSSCESNPWEETVECGPDEHLPWPKVAAVADWWATHRTEYQTERRDLLGRPISEPWCRVVLRDGRQRQRAHAALELAATHPAESLFEVRAPGSRQLACLAAHFARRDPRDL